jgi:hypothetical protein
VSQPYRCPQCRTRRHDPNVLAEHIRKSGHRLCRCGGYHYSHRPGSPYCEANPLSIMYLAARSGEPDESLIRLARTLVAEQPELATRIGDLCEHMNLRIAA